MKIVCAWCGGETGDKDGRGIDGVSHTICEGCAGEFELVVETEEDNAGENDIPDDGVKNYKNEGCYVGNRDRCAARGY